MNRTVSAPALSRMSVFGVLLCVAGTALPCCARADDQSGTASSALPQDWAFHATLTQVTQFHPAFTSPYVGTNSLNPGSRGMETASLTMYAGARPWDGGEIWADADVDQGYGLSYTYGVAAFPSGEAYKVGDNVPYFRVQRLFVRQTFDLGGDERALEPDANQLGGSRTSDNLIVTIGKIAVPDIFDTNDYAHDPSIDFLNWGAIDTLSWDYAADSWGYSYGGATEWTQSWWTLRAGVFDLSKIPNEKHLETGFRQSQFDLEAEERHTLFGRDGKLKLLGWVSHGRFGAYNDAVALGLETDTIPNTAFVRRYVWRPGAGLNLQQSLTDDLGLFARAGINDGSEEADEFTESNRSFSTGLSLKGAEWGRANDTVGFAYMVDGISSAAQDYLAHGGLGILVGDGRLPHYGLENVVESYYSVQVTSWLAATADYQLVVNPAYNPDRGPVSIGAVRFHAQI